MYSRRDFTGRNLTERTDMNGLTIAGSCFSQEIPDSIVFPPGMTGVTFINCNLDNCVIPPGNKVQGGSRRRFKVQNDLNDWEIDENDIPTNVMGSEFFYQNGLRHPNPALLPDVPVKIRIEHELIAEKVSWL